MGACTINPGSAGDPASTQSETGENSGLSGAGGAKQHNTAGAKNSRAGAAGRAGVTSDPDSTDETTGETGGSTGESGGSVGSSAGSTGETDGDSAAAGASGADAGPPPPCDLLGNCGSECAVPTVTCGVRTGAECEFKGFDGATAEVSCGKPTVVGIACCGACGCVPVEVYFDGAQCWQGIPKCEGHDPSQPPFLQPHATTTPNPSFTPPTTVVGSFSLGNGGTGGGEAVGGGGGTSSAGAADNSAGTSSGGAAGSAR